MKKLPTQNGCDVILKSSMARIMEFDDDASLEVGPH
jgi:hypothetical protein